jgi:hypothetical protein
VENIVTCAKCKKAIPGKPKTDSLAVTAAPSGTSQTEIFTFCDTCHASLPVGSERRTFLQGLLKARHPDAPIELVKG